MTFTNNEGENNNIVMLFLKKCHMKEKVYGRSIKIQHMWYALECFKTLNVHYFSSIHRTGQSPHKSAHFLILNLRVLISDTEDRHFSVTINTYYG